VSPIFNKEDNAISVAPTEAVNVLLWFGASMLGAGNTATRTREWIDVIARKLGFDAVSVALSLDGIAIGVRSADQWITAMRELKPPAINVWRIAELEQLAKKAGSPLAPREIAIKLSEIEATKPRYPSAQLAVAVGAASGGFAFLNGAAVPELMAAAIGGCIGQWLRSWLSRCEVNHYGVAALSAVAASGVYVLAAALASHVGFGFAHYPAGFIASVLFLVPGFPLIAALLDLMQHQTIAAVSRLAYGVMILLAVAFGLSIVIAAADINLSRQPPFELTYPFKLLLRAVASFAAGCAFAMLFNSSARTALAAGLLALGANSLRLLLTDTGMMLAPAAFFAALAIGLVAMALDRGFDVPRMATTVAPIVIMVPGIYAFEMIVLFNRGQMLDALQASASCGFVLGALAMGLATARFFSLNGR
jgi:uncharacterized membrane protein YjjP (DUF1212 family)